MGGFFGEWRRRSQHVRAGKVKRKNEPGLWLSDAYCEPDSETKLGKWASLFHDGRWIGAFADGTAMKARDGMDARQDCC